ncbi:MAG TPA: hypothetical protein VF159_01495 [Gemmatimonadaceae bacterium]
MAHPRVTKPPVPAGAASRPEIARIEIDEATTYESLEALLLRLATDRTSRTRGVLIDGRQMRSRAAFLRALDIAFESRFLLGMQTRVAMVTTFSGEVPNPRGFIELFGAPRGTIVHFWTVEEAEAWLTEPSQRAG